jgi:peptide/nickel transport system ATP-binding protein
LANERCRAEVPAMIPARGTPQTLVACHAVEEGRDGGPQVGFAA